MQGCDRNIIEVKISDVQCSVLVHGVRLLIVKGYQVGQFSLHVFVVTMSKYVLTPPLFDNGFQVYFLHSFPRSQGEAGTEFLKVDVVFILFQSSKFPPLTLISVIIFDL